MGDVMFIATLLVLTSIAVGAWFVIQRFRARIEAEVAGVQHVPASGFERSDLPPLLAAYVTRTALVAGAGTRWFRIRQTGAMRFEPEGDWKPFEATQTYAVPEPGFVWSANFKVFEVVDSLVDGVGRLEARVLGIVPVAKAKGAETTRAELLRYLAEIVWVPSAILRNPFVSWRQLNGTEVLGVLERSGDRVELRFHFDAQGDIERVEGVRERSVGKEQVPTPWIGRFTDYRKIDGVRMPNRGEVEWILDSGPFCYWRGIVTSVATSDS